MSFERMVPVLTGIFDSPGTRAILDPPNAVPEVLGIPGPFIRNAKPSLTSGAHSN